MDKFLTFAGAQPVYLGDVDFMQAAMADTFKQLARALMNSGSNSLNAILQGVEITRNGDNVTFSPGVVVINGEILPFEGVTLSTAPSYYFHVESTLSGGRTFKNGESHDCYETRAAVINTTSSGGVDVDSTSRLHDTINTSIISGGFNNFITAASLRVENNTCYLKIDYTATPEDNDTALAAFDVPPALAEALNNHSVVAFAVSSFMANQVIQPFIINMVATGGFYQIQFHLKCQWASEDAGSGTIYTAIPLFNL